MSQATATITDPNQTAPNAPNSGAPAVKLTKEQQQQHDRAVFRRLYGDEGGSVKEPGREPAATPAKPQPSPVPGAQHAPASEPSTPTGGDDGAQRRELEAIAHAVLRRDGLPEGARSKLIQASTPEELSAMVNHRRKVQADVDRLGNRAAQLERQGGKPAPGQTPTPPGDAGGELLEGLTPKQAAMVKKISDEGDEDRAREVADAFRESAPPASPAGAQRRDADTPPASGTPDEAAKVTTLLVQLEGPLDRLTATYPKLNSIGERREFIRAADRLAASGAFDPEPGQPALSVDDVLQRAAIIRYGGTDPNQAQRRHADNYRMELNGQPDASPSTPAGKPTPTGKNRDRQAYRLLAQGKSPEEVQRLLG